MAWVSKEKLERRVLTKSGKINPDATISDFVSYVGYRKERGEDGLSFKAYFQLSKFNDMTIRDLEKIRPYGLKRLCIVGIGEKKAGDLNKVLSRYGVKPIPWTTKRYRAYELKKELQRRYGRYTETVGDLLRKD